MWLLKVVWILTQSIDSRKKGILTDLQNLKEIGEGWRHWRKKSDQTSKGVSSQLIRYFVVCLAKWLESTWPQGYAGKVCKAAVEGGKYKDSSSANRIILNALKSEPPSPLNSNSHLFIRIWTITVNQKPFLPFHEYLLFPPNSGLPTKVLARIVDFCIISALICCRRLLRKNKKNREGQTLGR